MTRCSEGLQEPDLFLAHLVGHREGGAIALDGAGAIASPTPVLPEVHSTTMPPGSRSPRALEILDHLPADTVLDAAARVDVLELREDGRRVVGNDALEPRERRVADEVEDGRVLARHCRKAYFTKELVGLRESLVR